MRKIIPLLALLLATMGADCKPRSRYSYEVVTGPRTFRADGIVVEATQAWNPDALRAGGMLVPNLEQSSSDVRFRGHSPMELLLFGMPEFPDAPLVGLPYAALPPDPGPADSVSVWSLRTPFPVTAVRVIDHGACNLRVPLITGTADARGAVGASTSPHDLFPALDAAIDEQIHATRCQPDCTSSRRISTAYQALFFQRADDHDTQRHDRVPMTPTAVRDGFGSGSCSASSATGSGASCRSTAARISPCTRATRSVSAATPSSRCRCWRSRSAASVARARRSSARPSSMGCRSASSRA